MSKRMSQPTLLTWKLQVEEWREWQSRIKDDPKGHEAIEREIKRLEETQPPPSERQRILFVQIPCEDLKDRLFEVYQMGIAAYRREKGRQAAEQDNNEDQEQNGPILRDLPYL